MPIFVGNSTVNTAVANSTLTVDQTQNFAYATSNRNSIRPSLNLDFTRSQTVDPRITFTRASSATYFNSRGVLTTATTNAPRIDYDPATGRCLGLLIEKESTNVVYNSGAAGAVVGTPGTNPTNWNIGAVFGPTGLSTSIIGTGSESGIPYVDVRFFGTPTSTSNGQRATFTLAPGTVTGGQTWSGSVYCTLVGGSLTNVSYFLLEVSSGNPIFNGNSTRTFTPTVSALNNSRISTTYTLPAGSTILGMGIVMGFTINLPIDVTIRIAAPQLELLPFVTSFITTPSAATATRAVETPYITLGSWYKGSAFSFLIQAQKNFIEPTTYVGPIEFSNILATYRLYIINLTGSTQLNMSSVVNGIYSPYDSYGVVGSYTLSTPYKIALSAVSGSSGAAGSITTSLNGAAVVLSTTGNNFSGSNYSYMNIGHLNGVPLNGWMQGISYYPVALSNTELQTLTS